MELTNVNPNTTFVQKKISKIIIIICYFLQYNKHLPTIEK